MITDYGSGARSAAKRGAAEMCGIAALVMRTGLDGGASWGQADCIPGHGRRHVRISSLELSTGKACLHAESRVPLQGKLVSDGRVLRGLVSAQGLCLVLRLMIGWRG